MAHTRTPLKKVRRLGSAKEGTSHFWQMRVTSVAGALLSVFFVALIISLVGADYETVEATLAQPLIALGLLLFILTSAHHMWQGMQVIIEDYVHNDGMKVAILMLNTFFSAAVALAGVYAVLKLSFGV